MTKILISPTTVLSFDFILRSCERNLRGTEAVDEGYAAAASLAVNFILRLADKYIKNTPKYNKTKLSLMVKELLL